MPMKYYVTVCLFFTSQGQYLNVTKVDGSAVCIRLMPRLVTVGLRFDGTQFKMLCKTCFKIETLKNPYARNNCIFELYNRSIYSNIVKLVKWIILNVKLCYTYNHIYKVIKEKCIFQKQTLSSNVVVKYDE